ncbi:unnamed protein product [Oncorhynchus mykiss]|uniref:Cadherin domain-containing protein n=1 Tax=Oncorhynchus mykiss TaxID=8022 RepID=A0A060XBK8_ONCMY|nr:unnamed protein product [Oncorhynchus mykiss]
MGKLFTAIVMQILWSCSGIPGQQTSPLQFTQTVYNTTIYENSAAKSYVECPIKMGIYITDPSWDIQYKIESGDGEVLFKAEEYVLGDFSFLRIRTKGGSSAILNREVKEHYSLRVKALKWSTNAVAQTIVQVRVLDTNDLRPLFSPTSYTVSVPEHADIRTSIVRVTATDADVGSNAEYYFSLGGEHTHMFAIHPTSGVITLMARLDYAKRRLFEMDVLAVDRGMKLYGSTSTRVVINVIDVNNNAPVFQQPTYKGNVNENVPVGTSILTVSASDMDEGENGYVTYTIANVNPPQPFNIDYFTGVISTARELDYEKMPRVYNLRVRASDWGSPFRREVETPVSITLNNLNDNEPLFEKVDCEVSLPRYYRVGEQIVAVSAIDADDMEGVQHVVIDGNSLGLFDLTPDTGLLSLKLPLHYGEAARLSFHSLQISANDGETSSKPMFVNITDIHSINNYFPHFVDSTPKVIEVKEDLQVGMRIAHLSAIDADHGFSGTLMFVISGGDVESRFMIEMDTGWLKIMEPLDREIMDQYTLNITVYDLGTPQRSASHVLQINVLDSNDNSPNFLQNSYSVSIREDTDVGTAVIQVDATDKDSGANRIIRYSLMAESDHFVIDDQTGVVKVKSPLDRELHPTIILKVVACDQAVDEPQMVSTVSLKIVLEDINDNPPRFFPLHQRVKVREDLPLGAVVVWLQAHDPDQGQSGQVRFSLLDNGDGDFDVDKTNGAVRILRTLDFERRQVYNLTARAKDKGKPESLSCTCFIEVYVVDVDENLHQPRFASFVDKGSVREDAPVGTTIMTVIAQDNDQGRAGEIRYSIRDGSGLGVFTIDEESGVIQTQELLDHETTDHYWLTIYGTDLAVVPQSSFMEVYIEVEDVNDNAPQTSEPVYYPEVMENSPKDVSVIQVEAVDPDSGNSDKFDYKITSGNPQGFFSIDHQTGLVTTTSRKLDREQQEEHTLEITVTDKGVPARSTAVRVVVRVQDENDNTPQFLEKIYKVQLPERDRDRSDRDRGVAKSEPIYRVIASDRDTGPNAEVSYSIEGGDEQGRFFIEPQTGHVFSREVVSAGQHAILTIKVVDNGRPQRSSTCRLHIEWIVRPEPSSEPLVFEETSLVFSVMETDPVAHMVGVISTQPIDTPVWFQITGGNADSRFDVGKGSGTVILAKPLHAEPKSNYSLTVEATDGNRYISTQRYCKAGVFIKVIDTNNHQPQFSQPQYEVSIPEDTAPETGILQLSATDRDQRNRLTFTLLSSTDLFSQRRFRLDPGTGQLYTTEPLDHEVMNKHTLTVMVCDDCVPVKRNLVRVIVNVEDTNDNTPWFTSPRYSGQVFESAAVGSAVLQVTAQDRDRGSNAEISYIIESGNEDNSFAIDLVLGTITVAKELDRDDKSQFELAVKASDRGAPPLSAVTTVRIAVTVPDNARPRFPEEEISAVISETAPVGSLVTLVSASSHSSVLYQIREGNVNNAFDINPTSGVVVTQRLLDYESVSSYRLTVQATNMAEMVNYVTVLIHLRDENDNSPVFTQTEFRGVVSESAPVNSVVLTNGRSPLVIQATDADSDLNGRLVYQIVEPYALEYFAIDSSTGAIRTVTGLDYEQRSEFNFTVQVHDSGKPQLFSDIIAYVTIHITDVNDCPPTFSQDVFETSVIVPTYSGVKVISINATDLDSGPGSKLLLNEPLFYTILNPQGRFEIGHTSGVLFTTGVPFDREEQDTFEIVVEVTKEHRSSGVAHALVVVTIEDVNDNEPVFVGLPYSALVQLDSAVGQDVPLDTSIVKIQANASEGPRTVYSISKGDPLGQFSISFITGVFHVVQPLDYETHPAYRLSIRASDSLTGAHSEVFLDIILEDVNDNAPTFKERLYEASVSELADIDSSVLQVSATDSDSGNNKVLFYQLVEEGGGSEYFTIDQDSGVIMTSVLLDFEVGPQHRLVVRAVDGGVPAQSSEVQVIISVTDINDNPPVFTQHLYKAMVSQLAQRGHFVACVRTSDADLSDTDRLEYSLLSGNEDSSFTIDGRSGEIVISKYRKLNRETLYNLSVSVSDGLYSSVCNVQVTVVTSNLHSPSFSHTDSVVELLENSPVGMLVTQVTATDKDLGVYGKVTYYIVNDVAKDKFTINENGEIFTVESLDRENVISNLISISLMAKDGGGKLGFTSVNVILTDVNDNAPQFRAAEYKANIPRDVSEGTVIVRVTAVDADEGSNADITYTVQSEVGGFDIHPLNGDILKLAKRLDFETTKWYLLTLQAQGDLEDIDVITTAQLHIQVQDVNDNSPQFESDSYRSFVVENLPKGTSVIQVKATDLDSGVNGQVTYSLDQYQNSVDVLGMFAVDAESGWVTTLKELDREQQDRYSVAVLATDRGHDGRLNTAATVEVTVVDVNDNPMHFTAEVFRASDIPVPSRAITVLRTTDRDSEDLNKPICCFITGGDPRAQFDLEHSQGEWRVVVRRALDREERDSYLLNVTASDGTFVTTATVEISVLDANDNSPVCERALYAQTVPENAPEGRLVLQVSAIDADIQSNAQISYTLSGDGADYFSIESDTGRLRTLLPLDREERDVYSLLVQADDGGQRYCQANVVITVGDVNDNAPEFTADPYPVTVFENTEINTYVARLQATDLDAGNNSRILYSFEDSADGRFSIQQHSGLVRVERPLVRTQAGYTLRVRATDQGSPRRLSSVCSVLVSVLSVNDRPPAFQNRDYGVTVSEDVTLGTQVVRVFAASGDPKATADIIYSIVNGNEHGMFSMDSHTGDIFVTKSLDYEASHEHYLTVQASDKGRTSQGDIATVTIYLTDVNDNSPVFSQEVYSAVISEDTDMGLTMLTVMADDIDGPSNNHIHFSIVKGNQAGPFTIDTVSGEVKVVCPLDREKVPAYTLTVLASDSGSPSRSSSALVNIDVSDVNDNAPVFSEADYSLVIQDSVPVGSSVLKLTVTDRDASHNGPPFSFTILGGDEGGSFLIDPQGTLRTTTLLDRTVKDHYILYAQVGLHSQNAN